MNTAYIKKYLLQNEKGLHERRQKIQGYRMTQHSELQLMCSKRHMLCTVNSFITATIHRTPLPQDP
jgi:hypothetical protein